MNPETLKRIRAEAEAYAEKAGADLVRCITRDSLLAALRAAYLTGADAAYTAMLAEKKER